ncbi:MAG: FAD-dependent oxidoreductase [Actinomycetota bacterium]|nr:MAG: FAD-dependent oxidoreductase [Actinomycetota bacterium]
MSSETFDVDLLVVGGGMAGLTAAAYAARHGARVLVVEKAAEVGGSAAMSGGGMLRPMTADDLRAVNPSGDPVFAEMLAGDYDAAIEWIESIGVAVTEANEAIAAVMGYPTSLRAYDVAAYFPRCVAVVRGAGGIVRCDSEIDDLTTDDDGRVTGARGHGAAGSFVVNSRWTMLATGGFHNDPQLRSTYLGPHARDMLVRANRISDGAGLRLGLAVGGTTNALMDRFYGHTVPWPLNHEFTRADYVRLYQPSLTPHGILLDRTGSRFVDESLGYYRNSQLVVQQTDSHALLVGDQRIRDADAAGGAPEKTMGYVRLDRIEEAERSGAHVAVAPTLDDLDAAVRPWGYSGVRQAVERFNAELSHGGPTSPPRQRNRIPLGPGPFFAMEIQSAIVNTWGGLQVDGQGRVLRADGSPVAGLVAAGADIGGAYYEGYCGGLSMAGLLALRVGRLVTGQNPALSS